MILPSGIFYPRVYPINNKSNHSRVQDKFLNAISCKSISRQNLSSCRFHHSIMALTHTLMNTPPGLASVYVKLNCYGRSPRHRQRLLRCHCSAPPKEDHSASSSESKEDVKRWGGEGLAKMAVAAFAAGVLIVGIPGDAMAGKSGGRVGGQAFRSRPPPSSAPRSSGPRINNSRTNVFINPPVAPPIFGGYGFGTPFFGGWGWSPFSFFAPGPSVAIGVGGGFEFFGLLLVLIFVGNVIRNLTSRDDYDDDYFD